jgi:hypothetical protein
MIPALDQFRQENLYMIADDTNASQFQKIFVTMIGHIQKMTSTGSKQINTLFMNGNSQTAYDPNTLPIYRYDLKISVILF